jgi:integrin-linked kinase-associated serine/threonine phosphatase 2C
MNTIRVEVGSTTQGPGSLRIRTGVSENQGPRPTMEDASVVINDFDERFSLTRHKRFYAVYDGHGGSQVSAIAAEKFHEMLVTNEAFANRDYLAAFNQTALQIDALVKEQKLTAGSTMVAALLDDLALHVLNLGDSEAVLVRQGESAEAVLLSKKHSPTDPEETKRIKDLGGMVMFGRVFGTLAVSRSLGDMEFKEDALFVSPEMYASQHNLDRSDRAIVLACDGLWEKMTYAECAQLTLEMAERGIPPSDIGDSLARTSLQRGSMDNVSVVVILLDWDAE